MPHAVRHERTKISIQVNLVSVLVELSGYFGQGTPSQVHIDEVLWTEWQLGHE